MSKPERTWIPITEEQVKVLDIGMRLNGGTVVSIDRLRLKAEIEK